MCLSSSGLSHRWLKMPNLANFVLRSAAGIFRSRLIASSPIGGCVPSAMMKSSFAATAPAVSHVSRNRNGSGQVRVLSGMMQTTFFPRRFAPSIAPVKISRTSSSVSARSLKPRPVADMAFPLPRRFRNYTTAMNILSATARADNRDETTQTPGASFCRPYVGNNPATFLPKFPSTIDVHVTPTAASRRCGPVYERTGLILDVPGNPRCRGPVKERAGFCRTPGVSAAPKAPPAARLFSYALVANSRGPSTSQ